MKGKPALRSGDGSKGKPSRGVGGGSSDAKPKRTTAYHLFHKIVREDVYRKFGGKDGLAFAIRDNERLAKGDIPRGGVWVLFPAIADMWRDAPDVVKAEFKRQADVVNAWEEQRFAEEKQQQQQQQQRRRRRQRRWQQQAQVKTEKKKRVESLGTAARTKGGEECRDNSEVGMIVPSTERDNSEVVLIISSCICSDDDEDERAEPSTGSDDSDREADGVLSSTDSDSQVAPRVMSRVLKKGTAATSETETDREPGNDRSTDDSSDDGRLVVVPSTDSNDEDEKHLRYRSRESRVEKKVASSTASEREDGSLVPHTEIDGSSEDELITASTPAATVERGPTAPNDDATATRWVSRRLLASEMARTKVGHLPVEKQRASNTSMPLVSRPGPHPPDVEDANEPDLGTVRSPVTTPVGRGRGHARSAPKKPDSPRSSPSNRPSAEGKSPRPVSGRKQRADHSRENGGPSAREAGRSSPEAQEKARKSSGASLKATPRKEKKRANCSAADKEICDAGKKAGFEMVVGEMSLRSRMRSEEAEQAPRKRGRARRAASLDGRAVTSPDTSKTSPKRRASAAPAKRGRASPQGVCAAVSLRATGGGRRLLGYEARSSHGMPSVSKGRNTSRKSPATLKPAGRAEKRELRSTRRGTKPSASRGRTSAGEGTTAGKESAATATKTPAGSWISCLVKSTNVGGSVGDSRNRGTTDRTGWWGGGGSDSAKAGGGNKDACPETSSDETTQSSGEPRASSDDESEKSSERGRCGGQNGAAVARMVQAAWAGFGLADEKKAMFWHAGMGVPPSTLFGLVRRKDVKIEVLWDVERISSRTTLEQRWLSASVDLIDMNREAGHVDGRPLWNIHYDRHLSMPACKSQVAFLSDNKLRDMFEWDEEDECWMGKPLWWRPKQERALNTRRAGNTP